MSQAAMPMPAAPAVRTTFPVLIALSFCHLLNDMMQSLISALYPMLKEDFALDFAQIGLITLTFQLTASLLQPAVGMATDRTPRPFSLAIGMGSTLVGLLLLSQAHSYAMILFSAALVGIGSAVFHPESSRVARLASGGRYGLAQSLFQVGGNAGQAIGPLLAALVVLFQVGRWYRPRMAAPRGKKGVAGAPTGLSRNQVLFAILVLIALIFSKNVYSAVLSSYYTFYLMHRFSLETVDAQVMLFLFMASVAVGTLLGGPLGDRIGRKAVMWFSILGVLPFTLALPYADLFWTGVLTAFIGAVMASAFPAILVYAQELLPGRVGLVAGIFFGFAFGLGGLGAAVMGRLADATSIEFVFQVASFLPLIGLATALLPDLARARARIAG